MTLKEHIGKKTHEYCENVSPERVKRFAESVLQKETDRVSPSYLTVYRQSEFDLLESIGVSLAEILHGEQEYFFEQDLTIGEDIRYVSHLVNIVEKKGRAGSLTFLTFETEFQQACGVVGRSKSTMIIKKAAE